MYKKIDRKWKIVLEIVVLFLIVLVSAVYYYGLHLSFWPDPEYGAQTLRFFYMENFGGGISLKGSMISNALSYISYKIFGVGFQGLRVIAAVKYFIALFFCAVLSAFSIKERRMKWYLLPLFGFIAVVINPGSSKYCGFSMSPNHHQYPYDMHMNSVIFALLECFLLDILLQFESKSKKILTSVIIFIICIIGIRTTDLYFGISFWVPVITYFGVCLWKKNKKAVINIIVLCFGFFAVLRALSIVIVPLRSLFAVKELEYGEWANGNAIYGDSGFADFGNIWPSISNTLTSLMSLFNVEISGKSILSINTVIAAIRISLVVLIYVIAVQTIKDSLQSGEKKKDLISIICSYSVVFITVFVMFSSYGVQGRATRYLLMVVFYGSVLLCRNAEEILSLLTGELTYAKWVLFIGLSFCVLINVRPVWKEDSYYAQYEIDFQNLAVFIKENDLGIGVGDIWHAAPLTEVTEGECAVLVGEITDGELCIGHDCKTNINYFITGITDYFNVDGMYQLYGDPSEIYQVERFTIYYYEDGIDLK